MKILLIDNSAIAHINGKACIYKATGEFAVELARNHDLKLYGQLVSSDHSVSKFGLAQSGIKYDGVWKRRSKVWTYFLLYVKAIPEIISSDFVYIFYPSAMRYIAIICWLLSKPYGVYVRGEQGIRSRVSRFIYKKSNVIFTVADFFTTEINGMTGADNAYTIRPMIPFNEDDVVCRVKLSGRKRFNVLFLARMDKDKGIEELLYAFKELRQSNNNVFLTLIGDGGYLPHVRSLVDELGINDIVLIRGGVHCAEEIKQAYLDSDLYILPTYHEGFPRTIYEAMIFGTPVATTMVGGIPGLMTDGVNCLEIKPKSVQSIVEQLLYAIEHPSELYDYSVNARELVCKIIDKKRPTHAEHLSIVIRSK